MIQNPFNKNICVPVKWWTLMRLGASFFMALHSVLKTIAPFSRNLKNQSLLILLRLAEMFNNMWTNHK